MNLGGLYKVIYDPSFREKEDTAPQNSEKEKLPGTVSEAVKGAVQVVTGIPLPKKPKP